VGPWQEYALWRLRDADSSPAQTFALEQHRTPTRSSGARTRASFSRSLMSLAVPGTPGSSFSARSVPESSTDGISVGSAPEEKTFSSRLRNAGARSVVQPVSGRFRSTNSGARKATVPSVAEVARTRVEKLRSLYGFSAEPSATARTADEVTMSERLPPPPAVAAHESSARFSSLAGGSASLPQPCAAETEARESSLLAQLAEQQLRHAALEAQLARQQSATVQVQTALQALLDAQEQRDRRTLEAPASTSGARLMPTVRLEQGGLGSGVASSAAAPPLGATGAWAPVGAVRMPLSAEANTVAPVSMPLSLEAGLHVRHDAGSGAAPPPPSTVMAPSGVSDFSVDRLLRFIGPAAVHPKAAPPASRGTASLSDPSATRTSRIGEAAAGTGGSGVTAAASPSRRGSVPDAAADDLLSWTEQLVHDGSFAEE
jgi:hypothetical protein